MSTRRPRPPPDAVLAEQVFAGGRSKPFAELAAEEVQARAAELKAATGWGPTAKVACGGDRVGRAGAPDGATPARRPSAELDSEAVARARREALGRAAGRQPPLGARPYDSRPQMPNADDMLAVAAARAEELAAPGSTREPRRGVAVLACMDTRIDLFPMLGLERGDAHIIRNAGGLVTDDALRSLSASQRLLGTEEIVVVMHEGCGLHGASEDERGAGRAGGPQLRLGASRRGDDLRASLAR